MRKLRSYPELLIHREHYRQLLQSGRVSPQAHSLIRWHISKLTNAINRQWSVWWDG